MRIELLPFLVFLFLLFLTFTSESYAVSFPCTESLSKAPSERVQCSNEHFPNNQVLEALYIPKAMFNGATMLGAVFNHATLTSAQFVNATLDGASFKEAHLSNALFMGAKLLKWRSHPVTFQGAHLNGTKFQGSLLMEASFQGSDLSYAYFLKANIQGANFRDATLIGTRLGGALNFRTARFERAKYNAQTIFPQGFPSRFKDQMIFLR